MVALSLSLESWKESGKISGQEEVLRFKNKKNKSWISAESWTAVNERRKNKKEIKSKR